MALRTLLIAMTLLLPSEGWADQPASVVSVGGPCADGTHSYEYRVYSTGQRRGSKLLGFELSTCPAEASVLSFGVDDPSVDPDGDNVVQIAVAAGTTVTYDQSLAILETIDLLRSHAWTGMWAVGASSHPTTDVCSGPVVDYVLQSDLMVLPRSEVCPTSVAQLQ